MKKYMHNLTTLSKEDLNNLPNDALCDRMETVLYSILCESYSDPRAIDNCPRQSIKEFFSTKIIQSLSQENQRSALKKCFEYLTQHEYLSRVSGWLNDAIYNENYHVDDSWLSPRVQSINCAVNHIKIVGSGVAFERMMDLLHIIKTGEPISGKSKFKQFKKWLLDPQNIFVFFAPNLPYINKFRLRLRTAEIHEWSSLPQKILQLQRPTFEECNAPLDLINILIPMWEPLLVLLNNCTPENTAGSGSGLDWLKAITDYDISTIQSEVDRLKIELT